MSISAKLVGNGGCLPKIGDTDIRSFLLETIRKNSCKETIIVDEFGLCQGNARIDIAVVNGTLHGYEIKSDLDTLRRLPMQIELYNKVFDRVTIVSGLSHLANVEKQIPKWWGLSVSSKCNGRMTLKQLRTCCDNQEIDPNAVVQLLWKEEALKELRKLGLAAGASKLRRKKIWDRLVEALSLDDLKSVVRANLKSRQLWRPVLQSK